jgi:hypothetical protein
MWRPLRLRWIEREKAQAAEVVEAEARRGSGWC